MATAIKIKCLPEPELQFSDGRRDLDPRRALAANGPADHRGLWTIRIGLVGLPNEVNAARTWIATMTAFKPARERNARRFRDWPGSEKALGAKFEIDHLFERTIDKARYNRLFRDHMSADDFDARRTLRRSDQRYVR